MQTIQANAKLTDAMKKMFKADGTSIALTLNRALNSVMSVIF